MRPDDTISISVDDHFIEPRDPFRNHLPLKYSVSSPAGSNSRQNSSTSGLAMQTMLSPDITTWPADEPQLIGSCCVACTATVFPRQQYCPKCSASGMQDLLLPRQGTVIAWTTQGFPPGSPYLGRTGPGFEPFGVGLVQLGDVIRVEGRLTENDPEKLQFGQQVELTIIPLSVDEDGNELLTFAFRPVAAG